MISSQLVSLYGGWVCKHFNQMPSPHSQADVTGSILEIGLLNALRSHNDESYKSYRAALHPFYSIPQLPPSPHRPVVLGLHLLFHLANGNLTEFHTFVETLNEEELADDFVRLPVDL